jgi:hypothetical protein
MQDSDQEIIRRVLSNVVSRLEGGGAARPSGYGVEPRAGDASPVVFIVLNNAELTRGSDDRDAEQVRAEARRQAGGTIRLEPSHPGLERFASLEERSSSLAPKTCYMEPDRVCVNSGACEMRGY